MVKTARLLVACAALTLCAAPALADKYADANIEARLAKVLPGDKVDSIRETPVTGLYEVVMGPRVVYVSGDGRYLIEGRMIDLALRKDLTAPQEAEARKRVVDGIGERNMVIFSPSSYKYTITVFTDLDCAYCRKLHSHIAEYEAEGIRVRYVFFPREGVGSDSFDKSVAVWCSPDRQAAFTAAVKQGWEIPRRTCPNPVRKGMEVAESLGISGTPAIVLGNGDLIPGYVPPGRLAAILDGKSS
jgi:thiol:disulfide interchange protein DsbC